MNYYTNNIFIYFLLCVSGKIIILKYNYYERPRNMYACDLFYGLVNIFFILPYVYSFLTLASATRFQYFKYYFLLRTFCFVFI